MGEDYLILRCPIYLSLSKIIPLVVFTIAKFWPNSLQGKIDYIFKQEQLRLKVAKPDLVGFVA